MKNIYSPNPILCILILFFLNIESGLSQNNTSIFKQKKLEDKCACFKQWAQILDKHYPEHNKRGVGWTTSIYRDQYFVPFAGKPFTELTSDDKQALHKIMEKCLYHKKYGEQFQWEYSLVKVFAFRGGENSDFDLLERKLKRMTKAEKEYNAYLNSMLNTKLNERSYYEAPWSSPGFESFRNELPKGEIHYLDSIREIRLVEAREFFLESELVKLSNAKSDFEKIDAIDRFKKVNFYKSSEEEKLPYIERADGILEKTISEIVSERKNLIHSWKKDLSYFQTSNAWSDVYKKYYLNRYPYSEFKELYAFYLENRAQVMSDLTPLVYRKIEATSKDEDLVLLLNEYTYVNDNRLIAVNESIKSKVESRRRELKANAQLRYSPAQKWVSQFLKAKSLTKNVLLEDIKSVALVFNRKGSSYTENSRITLDSLRYVRECLKMGLEIDPESPYKLEFFSYYNRVVFSSEQYRSRGGIEHLTGESSEKLIFETVGLSLKAEGIVYRNGLILNTDVILASNIKSAIYNIDKEEGSRVVYEDVLVDLFKNMEIESKYPIPGKDLEYILASDFRARNVYDYYEETYNDKINKKYSGLPKVFSMAHKDLLDGQSFLFTSWIEPDQKNFIKELRKNNLIILGNKYKEHLLPSIYQETSEVAINAGRDANLSGSLIFGIMDNLYITEPHCFILINNRTYHTSGRALEKKSVEFDHEDMHTTIQKMTKDGIKYLARQLQLSHSAQTFKSPYEIEFVDLRLYEGSANKIILDRFELPEMEACNISDIMRVHDKINAAYEWYNADLLYFKDEAGVLFVAGVNEVFGTFEVYRFPLEEIERFFETNPLPYLEKYGILKQKYPSFAFVANNAPIPKWNVIQENASAAKKLSEY